jgi:hypothetical protein
LITSNVTGSRFQDVFTVSENGFLGTAVRVVSVDRRNLFTEPRATDIAQYKLRQVLGTIVQRNPWNSRVRATAGTLTDLEWPQLAPRLRWGRFF